MVLLNECSIATFVIALVWSFACVGFEVLIQGRLVTENSIATVVRALVRFFSGVDAIVYREV